MTKRYSLVVTPPRGGLEGNPEGYRFLFGGPAYRAAADAILGPHGEVRHLDWDPGTSADEFAGRLDEALPGATALVFAPWLIAAPPFDEARLDRAQRLRVIAGTFDYRVTWIDLDLAARRELAVVDTSRTMTWTVAEFGVAITMALLRDIPAAIDVVRGGGWYEGPQGQGAFVFRDLADCRVGLAGYGSINRHVRRFIAPYGCEVRMFDPHVDDEVAAADGVTRADSLVELASTSDILIVAIPPTPTTIEVVDASVIDAMAPGSLFVLLSRMAVVEQEPLWRRVRAGELRAAIDVFQPEPPPGDAWFRQAPNVLPTPHIAGHVQFAHERCFREACADAARVLAGEPPRHAVTVRDQRLYAGTLPAGRDRSLIWADG
jgi:phosphoglycerate dehydrogenase-like enzyme